MRPKVLITKKVSEEVENYIDQYCEYEIWDEEYPIPRKILLEKLPTLDGIMTGKELIDEEFLTAAKKLKIISNTSVGYDNFDIELMKRFEVMGTNTPHVLDETVADTAFGLMIMTARKLSYLDKFVKDGQWISKDSESFFGRDVNGATLGIIGAGRIGEKIMRRAVHGFNMKVVYHNRSRNNVIEKEYEAEYMSKETLLKTADFVMILIPLTSETENYISYNELNLMKKEAFLFNVSRGKVVDETALIEALREDKIAGAGLDVYVEEPLSIDSPLLKMNNVVTLPHVGSETKATRDKMAMKAAKNLVAGVSGKKPEDLIQE